MWKYFWTSCGKFTYVSKDLCNNTPSPQSMVIRAQKWAMHMYIKQESVIIRACSHTLLLWPLSIPKRKWHTSLSLSPKYRPYIRRCMGITVIMEMRIIKVNKAKKQFRLYDDPNNSWIRYFREKRQKHITKRVKYHQRGRCHTHMQVY